jgi:hypothetical protein
VTGGAVPDLSVIVVNYETGPLLGRCLAALRGATGDLALEVIVVDNASRDGSLEALGAFPEVQLVRLPANAGFARAVNAGLALAKGRALALLNPDAEVAPAALRTLVDALAARPRAGVVGPRLLNPDGSLQTSTYRFPTLFQAAGTILGLRRLVPVAWLRARLGRRLGRRFGQLDPHDRPARVDYVTGACLVTRREVVERVGGLDPRFFLYFEEKDFCRRVWQAGWQVWFEPAAEVVHAIGGSSRGDPRVTVVERCRSMRQYHDKHSGRLRRLGLRAVLLAGGGLRWLGAAVAGDRDARRAWGTAAGFGWRRHVEREPGGDA